MRKGWSGFLRKRSNPAGGVRRRCARSLCGFRRTIIQERDLHFLIGVADHLFEGRIIEEKVFAVFLLEKIAVDLGDAEFRLFESWLDRITSWADHDGLVHYLIAPMMVSKTSRTRRVFVWARSRNRWRRRAACVALIQGTRRKMFLPQIIRLSNMLLTDEDDMVQKGLGWLLRETAKHSEKRTIPYLRQIRGRVPRLVLRTACETLPLSARRKILAA